MLGDSIKALRKSKGLTQEELAIRLNVVRQTVSKWEKGISVPDAEALQEIADVLEVDIQQLLGGNIETKQDSSELVEQLARINEQLIIKNRRAGKIWKIIGFGLLGIVVVYIILIVLSLAAFSTYTFQGETQVTVTQEQIEEFNE